MNFGDLCNCTLGERLIVWFRRELNFVTG
jgi:hypothetical protein